MSAERSRGQTLAAVTAFVSLFAVVGLALYGLPALTEIQRMPRPSSSRRRARAGSRSGAAAGSASSPNAFR